MARRSGLGKGLGALIPTEHAGDRGSAFREVPISAIRPNPWQPRTRFDEESLRSLADSIRAVGVLQPVIVREVGAGEYELIAGERRWRAARRAGLQVIPALVQTASDVSSLERAVIENLHREDLNPLEEAAAYQQLLEDFGLTHEELAARVGKSRAAVTNTLRLLQLPSAVQGLLVEGRIDAGHARALLASPDRSFQEALARRAAKEGLSVRAVEEAVRTRAGETPVPRRRSTRAKPAALIELEGLLARHLDTRVSVELGRARGRATGGRIVVEFATIEDLERIYRLMSGTGHPQLHAQGVDHLDGPASAAQGREAPGGVGEGPVPAPAPLGARSPGDGGRDDAESGDAASDAVSASAHGTAVEDDDQEP